MRWLDIIVDKLVCEWKINVRREKLLKQLFNLSLQKWKTSGE